MTLRRASLAAALLLCAGVAWADVVSPAADAVTVTIYHDDELETSDLLHPDRAPWVRDEGLAVITETRQIDLPAGPSEIRFRAVASTMVPHTAIIEGLPAGTIERNFDYDLLSPGSLLAKSIGQTVHLIRTDPKTGQSVDVPAIVRTGPDGAMLDVGGKLEALRCSGLPERLVFDKAPDGLTDTPTLTVRANAAVAGHYTVKLTYIATGLNWSADYVAHVRRGGHLLDLTGWVTLANFGSTGFAQAPVAAVAGRLNVTGDDTPVHTQTVPLATHCWPIGRWWTHRDGPPPPSPPPPPPPSAYRNGSVGDATETVVVTGSRIPDPRALGDYKLYELPEPTDLPAHETKQVQFLELHDVPVERLYRYRVTGEDHQEGEPATLVLSLKNTAEGGLGKPLPAGTVAVTEPGPGQQPIFIGQAGIKDTPTGLPFELETGEVYNVLVTENIAEKKMTGTGNSQRELRTTDFEVVNNRSEAIAFELRMDANGDTKIVSETSPHAIDRGATVWRLALKPGERAQMRVTVDAPF